jgi:mitochondrial chaperone BCS1
MAHLALVRAYVIYHHYQHLPLTSKQSFITALAGELQYNICLLSISEHGMTDDRLNHALSIVPEQSIILLEDIDRAFVSLPDEHPAGKGFSSRVTFSGLLNALDGVAATERRIVFMTTNHIDHLDPALIRPGRVDVQVYVGDADRSQVLQMFARFYGEDHLLASPFADQVISASIPVSMAMLQGHFLRYKMHPQLAIDNINELFAGKR